MMMDLDPTLVTWLFVAAGFLLMLLETVIPGGVAFFLGVGGLTVAGLRAVGLLVDPLTAIVVWAFLSAGLTVALRPIALRYFGGTISIGLTDEDAEAMGQTVTVVEPVSADDAGRIRFRGATWDARTVEGRLPDGAEAKILYRDNLTWIVEPVDHSDLDAEFADDIGVSSSREESASSNRTSSGRSEDGGLNYDPSASPPNRERS
jgi:membrane protein implicated in regulation of membrane protease activity